MPLLITRPEPQAADFARALRDQFGDLLQIIHTPLLTPRFYAPDLPTGPFAGLILTSQTAVQAYLRLGEATAGLPRDVYCVGVRTAEAALAAQLLPVATARDAASLIALIMANPPQGRLLHLRGRESRGSIQQRLNMAAIDTENAVLYAQEQQQLTNAAEAVLRNKNPILVPLFSPRTARIFASELRRIKASPPLFVAAMSADVALELGTSPTQIRIAATPDTAAMLGLLAMLLTKVQSA